MLTIAEVSGLIAAAVIIVQYTLPAALVLVLIKNIGTVNSAVTWSVLNRLISTTVWPQLFRADAVSSRRLPLSTTILSSTISVYYVILIIASVLTPLGLYEEIVPGQSQLVEFEYIKDPGPWGRVTMPRPNMKFTRHCEYGRHINCPGQFQGVIFNETEPGRLQSVELYEGATINLTVPENYTAMFTSATSDKGNTVSGLFDIQYRRWSLERWAAWDKGQPFVRGKPRYIESLISQEDILIREGLIIDMKGNPGLGFRNHTIPIGLKHGGTWSEDITWIEAVTRCADTNLSIELIIENSEEDVTNNETVWLVDRGAFVGLNNSEVESPPWNDNQTLDLFGRAYKAARMHNVLMAASLNVSLPLSPETRTLPKLRLRSDDSISFSTQDFDTISRGSLAMLGRRLPEVPGYSNLSDFIPYYPDRIVKLLGLNYTAITQICKGWFRVDSNLDGRANNITNPAVQCGAILGAVTQTSSENSPFSMNSSFEAKQKNFYVCASGLRASVKTVNFQYNGTRRALSDLKVLRIADKTYREEESKPLWAVEHSYDKRMWFNPLWGIVDDRYSTMDGFYTQRSEGLWLPASPFLEDVDFGATAGYDSLAAVSGIIRRLDDTYDTGSSTLTSYDYSGEYEFTLFERFQRLSHNDTVAAQIPSLILTDKLAAALVGTKTSISRKYLTWPASLAVDDTIRGFPRVQVIANRRVIRYDLRYAIPAIFVLSILLVAFVGAIWALMSSGSVLATMQNVYNQTSAGRLATNLLLPGQCDPKQPSRKWARGDGALMLSFGYISEPNKDHFCAIRDTSLDEETPMANGSKNPAVVNTLDAATTENVPEPVIADNNQDTVATVTTVDGPIAVGGTSAMQNSRRVQEMGASSQRNPD